MDYVIKTVIFIKVSIKSRKLSVTFDQYEIGLMRFATLSLRGSILVIIK